MKAPRIGPEVAWACAAVVATLAAYFLTQPGTGKRPLRTLPENSEMTDVPPATIGTKARSAPEKIEAAANLADEGPERIVVTVTGPDGQPRSAVTVTLSGSEGRPVNRATDAAGKAIFGGQVGAFYEARAQSGLEVAAPVELRELPALGEHPVRLTLQAGASLAGVVTGGEGGALANATVTVTEGVLSFQARSIATNAEGKFLFDGLLRQPHRVWVTCDGYVAQAVIASPPASDVRVTLSRAAQASGTVVDEEGNAIEGARVEALSLQGTASPLVGPLGVTAGPVPVIPVTDSAGRSDRSGHFLLRGLFPGNARLVVRHSDFATASVPVTLTGDGARAGVRVTLKRGGRIEGRILDARGLGVADVLVELNGGADPFPSSVFADGQGAFAFEHVVGAVVVRAMPSGFSSEEVPASIRNSETLRIELRVDEALQTVEGRVVDERGFPVAGAVVVIDPVRASSAHTVRVLTEDDGTFSASALPSPPYRVEVSHQNYGTTVASRTGDARHGVVELDAIELKPAGSVTGVVVDSIGSPVSGASVQCAEENGAVTISDASGAFKCDDIAPSDVVLRASHAEGGSAESHPVRVRAGEVTPGVRITLAGRVTMAGDGTEDATAAPETSPEGTPEAAPAARTHQGVGVVLTTRGSAIVVTGTIPGTEAARLFRVGDAIVEVNGERVFAAGQARGMLRGDPGSRLTVTLSNGRTVRLRRESYSAP